jgi:hypothetical protein
VPSGGIPPGEGKTDIAAVVERKEKDPVSLSLQEAAQADIEALLVARHGSTNGGMNDKGDALALADLFDTLETQHG